MPQARASVHGLKEHLLVPGSQGQGDQLALAVQDGVCHDLGDDLSEVLCRCVIQVEAPATQLGHCELSGDADAGRIGGEEPAGSVSVTAVQGRGTDLDVRGPPGQGCSRHGGAFPGEWGERPEHNWADRLSLSQTLCNGPAVL